MPEDAPVRKTFTRAPAARCSRCPASALRPLRPRLGDKRIDRARQSCVPPWNPVRRGDEFPVDNNRGYGLDVVSACEALCAVELAVHRERSIDFRDFVPIEPLARGPVEKCLVLIEGK